MGIERVIQFANPVPEWPAIASAFQTMGVTASIRMIDGLPAFPDEIPEPGWKELRLGLAGGMVTLRRVGPTIHCVTWGTADPGLQKSWDHCTCAVATAGNGTIALPDGSTMLATEFQRQFLEPT